MSTDDRPVADAPVYMGLPHEKLLRPRLYIGAVLTLGVMVLSMGPMAGITGLPTGRVNACIQAALTAPIFFWCGAYFLKRWWKSLRTRDPNMFSLTVTGTGAAFFYSLWILATGGEHALHEGLYFEAAAFTTTAVLLGQILEQRANQATEEALRRLADLSPKTATRLLGNGDEERVLVDALKTGDRVRVRPGESLPADGRLISGHGAVDESLMTGEAEAVEKRTGSEAKAGTINRDGSFVMEVTAVGEATTLAHLIQLVGEAAESEPPIARVADKVLVYFVPVVLALAGLTFGGWCLAGGEDVYARALGHAVAVLVIACPCTLGLATPVAIVAGIGRGAREGILVREAAALEALAQAKTLGIDKTGTLTAGRPHVTAVHPEFGYTAGEVLALAAAVERHSEHPLARAIVERAAEDKIEIPEADAFSTTPGFGVEGMVLGQKVSVRRASQPPSGHPEATAVEVTEDGHRVGYLFLNDTLKEGAAEAVAELQHLGLAVTVVSGDREGAVAHVAAIVGADSHMSAATPQEKLDWLRRSRIDGSATAFVGDGINDAPALVAADAGMAVGNGSDIAKFSAGIVILSPKPSALPRAVKLSRAVMRTIKGNLFFAFFYNCLAIPLASGVLIPLCGWHLHSMVASVIMSLSSLSVVGNALRLRNAKI